MKKSKEKDNHQKLYLCVLSTFQENGYIQMF